MRVTVYARKSTRDQRDADDPDKSVARQQALARDFAASKGWDIVSSFVDDGVSGLHRNRLVGRAKLFLAAEEGLFDVVIVRDTDRLSRDDVEADPVVTLANAGVAVWEYSTGRPVDVSDPTNRLVRHVHRYRGASEAESGSKRTREQKFERAKAATIADGRVLGYRNVGEPKHRRREIDPDQAKLVVRIFKMAADGKGYLKIARTLNAARVKNPNGQDRRNTKKRTDQWSTVGIREILRRELYCGRVTYGVKRNVVRDGGRKKTTGEKPVTIDRPDLRIIDDTLWRSAQQRMATTRETYTGRRLTGKPGHGRESKHLLAGLLACGVCGGNLIYSRKTGQRGQPQSSYVCTTRRTRGAEACSNRHGVPVDGLTTALLEQMRLRFLNPAMLAALIEQERQAGKREPDDLVAERDGLTGDVARIGSDLARLAEAVASGAGDVQELVALMRSKRAARSNAEARIIELTGQIDARTIEFDRRQWLRENRPVIDGMSADLFGKDTQAARRVFKQLLISPIVVNPQVREDGVIGFSFRCEASFAGLSMGTWQRWDIPASARRNPHGLYAPDTDDGPDTDDDDVTVTADGSNPFDLRLANHLLVGTVSRRVQNKCPRGDSNTRHAV